MPNYSEFPNSSNRSRVCDASRTHSEVSAVQTDEIHVRVLEHGDLVALAWVRLEDGFFLPPLRLDHDFEAVPIDLVDRVRGIAVKFWDVLDGRAPKHRHRSEEHTSELQSQSNIV